MAFFLELLPSKSSFIWSSITSLLHHYYVILSVGKKFGKIMLKQLNKRDDRRQRHVTDLKNKTKKQKNKIKLFIIKTINFLFLFFYSEASFHCWKFHHIVKSSPFLYLFSAQLFRICFRAFQWGRIAENRLCELS